MASLIDSNKVLNGTGTPVTIITTPSMTLAVEDWVIGVVKWEGTNGSTCSFTSSVGLTNTGSIAVVDHTNNDLHGQMFYGRIASGTSGTFSATWNSARPYVGLHCLVARPAGGTVFVFDAAATSLQGNGGVTIATGATANAGAGFGVAGFSYYSSTLWTAGSGWTMSLAASEAIASEYRLLSGAGTPTGDANPTTTGFDWIAMMLFLKEQAGGGAPASQGQGLRSQTFQSMGFRGR